MNSKSIALVLSSGGARGLAHIGAIDALLERGYHINAISGTSMGSVVGGMYACGKLEEFRKFITSLSRLDVYRLIDLGINKKGLIKGERVFGEMKQFVGDILIEDLPIPFAAVSADLINHSAVVFTKGNLLAALRASTAIPSLVLPVSIDEALLVDGGIVDPLPIEQVKRTSGDLLVAVNVNAPREEMLLEVEADSTYQRIRQQILRHWPVFNNTNEKKLPVGGMIDIMSSSFELMQHQLTLSALQYHSPDILVSLPVNLADTFDFYRAAEIIQTGYEAMIKQLVEFEHTNTL
ncbi:MAG: patatin-like phospholipase family protein [Lentimicrobium sp.]|jgi:NTE family protein|nr:patatin-like phospholipase family protein [Lentimicrobium sp.]